MGLLLWLRPAPASAGGGGLRAQIYLVQRPLPRRATEGALLRFARSHHTSRLQETKEDNPEDRKWQGHLIVHFNRPPGDLEFHVLFYDTQDGAPRFVDDMAVYLNARDQRTYVQRLVLSRPKFKPERRMELVVLVGHREVGRRSFQLRGEKRHRSGEVAFSEEEAQRGVEAPEHAAQPAAAPSQAQPEPATIPEEEEDIQIDERAVGSAEDMELPAAPEASRPPEPAPSAAGRRGGLCAVGGSDPLQFGWLLAWVGWLLARRRSG